MTERSMNWNGSCHECGKLVPVCRIPTVKVDVDPSIQDLLHHRDLFTLRQVEYRVHARPAEGEGDIAPIGVSNYSSVTGVYHPLQSSWRGEGDLIESKEEIPHGFH